MHSGYVLAGYELEKLEFWHWYNWANRGPWLYPFRTALRMYRIQFDLLAEVWPIDL